MSSIANSVSSAVESLLKNYTTADGQKALQNDFTKCEVKRAGKNSAMVDYVKRAIANYDPVDEDDKAAQAEVEKEKKIVAELKVKLEKNPRIAEALSNIPFTHAFTNRSSDIMNTLATRATAWHGIMGNADRLETLAKFDTNAKVSDILKKFFTPLKGTAKDAYDNTDYDRTKSDLADWSVIAGGLEYTKAETLAEQVQNGTATDAVKAEAAKVASTVNAEAALIVSLKYYMLAGEKVECDDTQRTPKDSDYLKKARVWATIARLADNSATGLEFAAQTKKFEDKLASASSAQRAVPRLFAAAYGIYKAAGVNYIDATITKLAPDSAPLPSAMVCEAKPSSTYWSQNENAIVALWRSAMIAVEGKCIGKIPGGGGGGGCPSGFVKVNGVCKEDTVVVPE